MHRNFKMISRVVFGRGCFGQVGDILDERRRNGRGFVAFLVDDVFMQRDLRERIPLKGPDHIIWVNVKEEPTTAYVDELTLKVKALSNRVPEAVVGIGGGSTMDLAKAVALMLTNPGSATDYQGWDLIKNPAVYKVGIPTLAGTGAEVSRTTVLIGPQKKLGINSDYTLFDQIVLDPELLSGAPPDQYFYTGMDCYIHCIESLTGTFLNAFSQAYGEKARDLCREVFLGDELDRDDKLMMASYFGGMSIAYSQVGVCHALSYGLSFELGIHHGIGNCIAFDYLEEYYSEGVREFRAMMERQGIKLPRGVMEGVTEERISKMIDAALFLDPLWEHAFGPDWREIMTRDKIRELYQKM